MASIAPAHRSTPHMTQPPDSDPTPQAQAGDPVAAQHAQVGDSDPTPQAQAVPANPAEAAAAKAKPARPGLRDQIAENPLLSLFGALMTLGGTAVVALLLFTLTSIGNRIDGVEMSLGERIDRVEVRLSDRIDRVEVRLSDRIDRLEDKVDTGFAVQGAQIGELDRKLTALIAHLNATEAVEAALEHRLLMPGAGTTKPEGKSPG